VHVASIPHEDHTPAKMAEQVAEEKGRLGTVDKRARMGLTIEANPFAARRKGQSGDDRHLLTVPAALIENGSLATRRLGSADQRRYEAACLIDEPLFKDARPIFRQPCLDSGFIPFARHSARLLRRDASLRQPRIDRSWMKANVEAVENQFGDSWSGPEFGDKAELTGALEEPRENRSLLLAR
jgi:hypothetical protein